jgi:hypothetical protein
MACDCKAGRQIYEMGRMYGTTQRTTRRDRAKTSFRVGVQKTFLVFFAFFAAPVLFLKIVVKAARGEKVIHIDRMVGLNREQNG